MDTLSRFKDNPILVIISICTKKKNLYSIDLEHSTQYIVYVCLT